MIAIGCDAESRRRYNPPPTKGLIMRMLGVVLVPVLAVSIYAVARAADEDAPRDRRPPTTGPAQMRSDQRPPSLHRDMEAMGRLFKRLKSQVNDASKNDDSLALVAQMQQLTLGTKSLVPAMVAKMPTTQQAQETKNYRHMMIDLFRHELDLEEQLLQGENKKAAEIVATMDELQDDGHKEFRPKREGRGRD
jgi:hypothetical protein